MDNTFFIKTFKLTDRLMAIGGINIATPEDTGTIYGGIQGDIKAIMIDSDFS